MLVTDGIPVSTIPSPASIAKSALDYYNTMTKRWSLGSQEGLATQKSFAVLTSSYTDYRHFPVGLLYIYEQIK